MSAFGRRSVFACAKDWLRSAVGDEPCECGLVRASLIQRIDRPLIASPRKQKSPREAGLFEHFGTLVTGHHRELPVRREGFRLVRSRLRCLWRKRLRNRRRRDLAGGQGRCQLRRRSRRCCRVVVVFACGPHRRHKAKNGQRGCRQHSLHGQLPLRYRAYCAICAQ